MFVTSVFFQNNLHRYDFVACEYTQWFMSVELFIFNFFYIHNHWNKGL